MHFTMAMLSVDVKFRYLSRSLSDLHQRYCKVISSGDINTCGQLIVIRRLRGIYRLHLVSLVSLFSCMIYSSFMKIEAKYPSGN
jgi:hypothetical protein